MSGVTDPTKISVNGPTTAAPLQSIMSFLRNIANGAASLSIAALTLATAVKTPAVGQVGLGDTGWHEIGAANEPAFTNGWANSGGGLATAAFRKLPSGLVIIKGSVTRAAGANGTAAFTLSVGYRPALDLTVPGLINGGTASMLNISATGAVAPDQQSSGSTDHHSVNCTFYAEQ